MKATEFGDSTYERGPRDDLVCVLDLARGLDKTVSARAYGLDEPGI